MEDGVGIEPMSLRHGNTVSKTKHTNATNNVLRTHQTTLESDSRSTLSPSLTIITTPNSTAWAMQMAEGAVEYVVEVEVELGHLVLVRPYGPPKGT